MSGTTCPSCNTPVPPGAIFCDNCGYDLRTVAEDAQQPIPPTELASTPGAGGVICSTCQHNNISGSAFCENCGAQLSPTPPSPKPPVEALPPKPPSPALDDPTFVPTAVEEKPSPPPSPAASVGTVTGRLVFQDSNVSLPIPSGKQKIVLGREDPVSGIFPDIDLDPHGGHESGVGRQHAQLILQGGQVHLEDLDSVNGTVVNKQRLVPRQPHPLKHGDVLRLGKLVLIYYTS